MNLNHIATVAKANKELNKYISGSLSLDGLTSAEGLVLPKNISGFLSLNGLTSAEGLVLPKNIGCLLSLDGLTSAEKNTLQKQRPDLNFRL